jgi:hypothetical protein
MLCNLVTTPQSMLERKQTIRMGGATTDHVSRLAAGVPALACAALSLLVVSSVSAALDLGTCPTGHQVLTEYAYLPLVTRHHCETHPAPTDRARQYPEIVDRTGDVSDPGHPAEPTADFLYGAPALRADLFDGYYTCDYVLLQQRLHGRDIIVYVHRDLDQLEAIGAFGVPTAEEFALAMFNTFDYLWRVFGGFPYTRLIMKQTYQDTPWAGQVAARQDSVGYVLWQYRIPRSGSNFWMVQGHEMFHAWNICSFKHEKHDWYWFEEGFADLYGSKAYYFSLPSWPWNYIAESWEQYCEYLTEHPDYVVETPPASVPRYMLYRKSSLVAYMIDKEMRDRTGGAKSADALMRYMYDTYSTTDRYSTSDVLDALKAITGSDFSEFFARYVYGAERLPLDDDDFSVVP